MVLYYLDTTWDTNDEGQGAEVAGLASFPTEWITGINDAMDHFGWA